MSWFKRKRKFDKLLIKLNACEEAREWAKGKSIEDIVNTCDRGDWLLWLTFKMKMDKRKVTLAKAKCARTVIHLMKDERSVNAINVAEKYGLGLASDKELDSAYVAAYDAYVAAADYVAADYVAADAAYIAAAAAAADNADYVAADAVYVAADAAAARKKNQKQTADICREIFGDKLIENVNKQIKDGKTK